MMARKDTIKAALQTAKRAKYPAASSRKVQKEAEWSEQQKETIKTLKELLK